MRRLLLLLAITALVGMGTPALGGSLLQLQVPSWLSISQVSENMVINGLASDVLHLVTSRSVDEVIGYFSKLWACDSGEGQCKLVRVAPWSIYSHLDDTDLLFLQVRRQGMETVGYVVQSELKTRNESRQYFSHMQGSEVKNDLVSGADGRSVRTILVANGFSLTSNKNYYDSSLTGQGWKKVSENANVQGELVIYQKGRQEISLVLRESGGQTNVVISITGT